MVGEHVADGHEFGAGVRLKGLDGGAGAAAAGADQADPQHVAAGGVDAALQGQGAGGGGRLDELAARRTGGVGGSRHE
jgi:hypothetical protein